MGARAIAACRSRRGCCCQILAPGCRRIWNLDLQLARSSVAPNPNSFLLRFCSFARETGSRSSLAGHRTGCTDASSLLDGFETSPEDSQRLYDQLTGMNTLSAASGLQPSSAQGQREGFGGHLRSHSGYTLPTSTSAPNNLAQGVRGQRSTADLAGLSALQAQAFGMQAGRPGLGGLRPSSEMLPSGINVSAASPEGTSSALFRAPMSSTRASAVV